MARQSHRQSRRRVLSILATAGSLGLAGCFGENDPTTETNTTKPSNSTDQPTKTNETTDTEQALDEESWDETVRNGKTHYTDDPNWRMLGHDTGNSFINPHAEGPSDNPSVQWTIEGVTTAIFDGYRYHHPLIVDGTVYTTVESEATRASEEESNWEFLSANAETGQTETVFEADDKIYHPTIVDGTVYVAVGGTVRAYDLDTGLEQWRQELSTIAGVSAIRIVDDVVIATRAAIYSLAIGTEYPHIWGFDAATGELLWKESRKEVGRLSRLPIISDGAVRATDMLTARALQTGDVLEELPMETLYTTLRDGTVYGLTNGKDKSGLVSYDWSTLETNWTYSPEGNRKISAGWPVVLDGIIVVKIGRDGLVGLDRDTGKRIWHTPNPWDDYLSSFFRVATQETVYIVHDGGAATALDPTDGSFDWKLRTDEMGWNPVQGCALADDLLVTVGHGGTLYAIS